jgi:iron complex outermembrane receptor protein
MQSSLQSPRFEVGARRNRHQWPEPPFRRNGGAGSVALAFFTVAWVVVPTANAQQAQTLERVTVTGSNIERTDQETVAPIEILTREQIERTGRPTIADVLRTIPANLGGSYSESFTNSFAGGAAGISLRGLGQKTTLVLLNGRRVAGYGFAQNLQDTFVDLNSIPTSAIERVENLKDGASAIYGSDAIAGVINIILRRDYEGIEAGGSVGFFEGANDYRANFVAGFGALGSDKFNVFGVFDYYKRDILLSSDTKHGETLDFRGEDGGRNFESLSAGGTWLNGNNRRAMSECAQYGGFVVDYAGAVERGLIAPGTSTALNLPGNSWCGKDFANERTALPATERYGFLGRGTYDFSATTQAFAEFGWSRVETIQNVPIPWFTGATGLTQTAAGLRPFTYNVTFGPGVAGNPFDSNSTFLGNVHGFGTPAQEIKSDSYRLLGGLRYSSWGWDFESAIGWSKNEVDQADLHRLSKTATSAAFGVPSDPTAGPPPAFPPNPVSTGSTVNVDQPSATLAASQAMLVTLHRTAESDLRFIDTKATTAIGKLPGGPIGVALGAEFRKEELQDNPDPRAAQGDVLGTGITATDGDRDNFAMYAELALPLTRQLEAQLALRYDDYSDFGSAVTPKIGAKFKPTPGLLFRATWGRGFRAPSLPEISPSVATFFVAVIDPLTNQLTGVSGMFAGNPDLDPEKSRNTTIGVVWEPNASFNIALNWYQITWSNVVASPSFQSIVNSADPNKAIRDPITGRIVTVISNYENLSSTETSGVDIEGRWIANTERGRFTTRLNATYVDSFEEEGVECVGTNGCTNAYPRWKGYLSLDWDRGPWAATARVNYIHSYVQMLLPGSFFVPQDPRFQTGTYPERVPSYTTLDLFARYDFSPMLRVFASIINVTDETPPYSGTAGYDFTQYDIRGRQYRVGFNCRFR